MNESIEERMSSGPPKRGKQRSMVIQHKARSRPPTTVSSQQLTHKPSTPDDKPEETLQQPSSGAIIRHADVTPIRNQLSTDWQDVAMCRLFADYVLETDDLHFSPGFLDKLPKLYNKVATRESVLGQALSAVSLANYSNQVYSKDMLIQARKSYGKGLTALHKALSEGFFKSD